MLTVGKELPLIAEYIGLSNLNAESETTPKVFAYSFAKNDNGPRFPGMMLVDSGGPKRTNLSF